MKMIKKNLFILTVSLLIACESLLPESSSNDTDDYPVTDIWWWLDAFEDKQGNKTSIGTEDVAIIFRNDSTLSGIAVWRDGTKGNEIFGVYQIEPAKICTGSTRKGVPEGSRSSEFVQMIRFTKTFQVTSNSLVLTFQDQDELGKLYLKRGESPPYEVDFTQSALLKQTVFSDCI